MALSIEFGNTITPEAMKACLEQVHNLADKLCYGADREKGKDSKTFEKRARHSPTTYKSKPNIDKTESPPFKLPQAGWVTFLILLNTALGPM